MSSNALFRLENLMLKLMKFNMGNFGGVGTRRQLNITIRRKINFPAEIQRN